MTNMGTGKLFLIGGVLISLVWGGSAWLHFSTVETVDVNVKRAERQCSGSGDSLECKYIVFTDNEVFQNVDSLLALKFNSSDIQNQLMDGGSYTFKVNGIRSQAFSLYRNILEIEKIK